MKAKKYLLNFSSQFVVNIIGQAIALITVPYAARILGVSKFGEYNFASTIMMYALLLPNFGFPLYASRMVPRLEGIADVVNVTLTLKLILSVISFMAMVGLGVYLHSSPQFLLLCIVFGFYIFANSLDLRWVFVAKDLMAKVAYTGLLGQMVFAVLLVFVVKSSNDIVGYASLQLVAVVLPAIISIFLYYKFFGGITLTLRFDRWRELITESVPLGMTSLTATFNVYFAGLMIGLYLTTREMGLYSAGFKLMMVFNMLYNLVSTVLTPTVSRLYAQNRDRLLEFLRSYFLVCLVMGLCSSAFLFLSSGWIVRILFGPNYSDAVGLVKIWALGLLPLTPLSIFSISSLIACNASKESMITIFVGSIVSFASVLTLVSNFGIAGVPFSHVLMEMSVSLLGSYFLIRKLSLTWTEVRGILNLKNSFLQLVDLVRVELKSN